MAASEAQKRASAKWDKTNMASLACRVKMDTANAFRELCASRGTTVSKEIAAFVKRELDMAPEGDYAARAGLGEVSE